MNATYLRVSSEEQRERQNIQTQAQYAEQYGALKQLAFSQHFRDDGISGTLPLEARPAGAALLEAARAGVVKTVYVYRLDRLGRDLRVILNAVHALDQAGCTLVSMTETFETVTPAGKAMLGMLSVFAAFERDSMQARIRDGYDAKARLPGKFLGGPRPPFGYAVQGKGPAAVLVIAEEEADVVRQIFALAVGSRLSSREIADQLNAAGSPTPFAGSLHPHYKTGLPPSGLWIAEAVARVLHNSAYQGIRYHNKRSVRPLQVQECPPLVTPEVWQAAQDHLTSLRNPRKRKGDRVYLLRGLLRCGRCGHKYYGWPGPNGNYYYKCHGEKRAPKCGGPLLPARTAEPLIWAELERWLHREATAARSQRRGPREKERAARRQEAERLQGRIEQKGAERERVLSLFRRGVITDPELDRQLLAISSEQQELLTRWQSLQEVAGPVVTDRSAVAQSVLLRLQDPSPDLRQEIAAQLIERIEVRSKTDLEIAWRV